MMLTPLMRDILNQCGSCSRDMHWFLRPTNNRTTAAPSAIKNAIHIMVHSGYLSPAPMDTYNTTSLGRRALEGDARDASTVRITNASMRGDVYRGPAWQVRPGGEEAAKLQSRGLRC